MTTKYNSKIPSSKSKNIEERMKNFQPKFKGTGQKKKKEAKLSSRKISTKNRNPNVSQSDKLNLLPFRLSSKLQN